MIKSYRDLEVWQRAVTISVITYRVTQGFPSSESYGLSNQMRRASVSIASNIAEGFGRSNRQFHRYLLIARGSLSELETQVEIAHRINILSESSQKELSQELTILGKQLNVLLQKVAESTGKRK